MDNIYLLVILLIATMLFLVISYVFVLIRFTKVDKALKLVRLEAQSSNAHWQAVYENLKPAKQIYPIHFDKRQVIELNANMSVTREMEIKVSKQEVLTILKQLKEENMYNQFKYAAYDEAIRKIESMGADDEN